jgi:hypothetical protein
MTRTADTHGNDSGRTSFPREPLTVTRKDVMPR